MKLLCSEISPGGPASPLHTAAVIVRAAVREVIAGADDENVPAVRAAVPCDEGRGSPSGVREAESAAVSGRPRVAPDT
jgi:hypothetical protein